MSITKYASVFSKKWGGRVGDTTKTQAVWSHRGRYGFTWVRSPASLGAMCLKLKYFSDWDCCKKHPSLVITPGTSSLVPAQDTLGEGKVCPCFSNLDANSSPPHTIAQPFHWFKGLHCSIHQRCGGMLSTLSTWLPAQCHLTNICTWQMWGCTPLSISIKSTRAHALCFQEQVSQIAHALLKCHHMVKTGRRGWRLSRDVATSLSYGSGYPHTGIFRAHRGKRLQVPYLPQARLQSLTLCFSSWGTGREQ